MRGDWILYLFAAIMILYNIAAFCQAIGGGGY